MSHTSSSMALTTELTGDRSRTNLLWFAALAFAGSMLIALAGKVVVPGPVNFTLQTLAIFLIAAAFGRKLAVATVLLYIAEGAAGLPVFTNGGGLAYFAGPTTGYLAGFVVAAGLTGWAADRGMDRSVITMSLVNLLGSAIILAMGAAWIALVFGADKALAWGVGPFIATDVIKALLAAGIGAAFWKIFRSIR